MFEYMTITLTAFEASDPVPAKLHVAGADGWELVSAVATAHDGCIICFMKRPTR